MAAVKLHITDTGGPGRPVVLIHGWPLSAEAWEGQIPALKDAGYRVVAYDRRGFGQSDKPDSGFDYDSLAEDLHRVITGLDLRDVTLVGFSMGGGEVVRYLARYGADLVQSAVLAAAIPPMMLKTEDNPEGPLTQAKAAEMKAGLIRDRESFFDGFTRDFYSAHGALKVSEDERQKAIALCHQSDQTAALGCMEAFGTTDFRRDLQKITLPVLVLHGDADGIVPLEGSGARSHAMLEGSLLHVLPGAPHGCNVSHRDAFNAALLDFLGQKPR